MPAGEIEEIVIGQFRRMIASPEVIVATWKQSAPDQASIVRERDTGRPGDFDEVWGELFPAEQQRITSLLIERVVVFPAKVDVHLQIAGFTTLVTEMKSLVTDQDQAA